MTQKKIRKGSWVDGTREEMVEILSYEEEGRRLGLDHPTPEEVDFLVGDDELFEEWTEVLRKEVRDLQKDIRMGE